MSNSTSHPCFGSVTHRAMCSSEGTSPTAQITQVLDFVFLGSQDDAQDAEILKRHGITKVINLSDSCPKSDLIPNHCFMRIPIKDSYDTKIWPYFDKAYEFIGSLFFL
jgi:dual specificity MAP kinase phosphatase